MKLHLRFSEARDTTRLQACWSWSTGTALAGASLPYRQRFTRRSVRPQTVTLFSESVLMVATYLMRGDSSYTAGLTLLCPPIFTPRVRVPNYAVPCAAGFPSPAQDYAEKELDLNELCIRRRASIFFVRASGNSMRDLGLCDGDVMVVDRA